MPSALGLRFEPARGASALEDRALRGAVDSRRDGLHQFLDAEDALFSPRVRLLGEHGPVAARERAARRLETFVAAEASRRLFVLKQMKEAIADGRLKGLARGLAYQLVEQFWMSGEPKQTFIVDRRRTEIA